MAFVHPFPNISEKPFRVDKFIGGYWLHKYWYAGRPVAEFQASSTEVRTGIKHRVVDERYELDEADNEEYLQELFSEQGCAS